MNQGIKGDVAECGANKVSLFESLRVYTRLPTSSIFLLDYQTNLSLPTPQARQELKA